MANRLGRPSSPRIRPARRISYGSFTKDPVFGAIFDVFETTLHYQGICTFGQVLKAAGYSNFSDSIPWPHMRRRYEEKHDTILMPLSRDRNRTLVISEAAGNRVPVGYTLVDERNSSL